MTQPSFVPIVEADQVRPCVPPATSPATGASRDRSICAAPRRPAGRELGKPGPDQGFALMLARRFEDRLVLAEGDTAEDAIVGCTAVAMRRVPRCSAGPRWSTTSSLAFTLWGFLGGAPADLVAARAPLFRAAAHHYQAQRAIADSVAEETLRLTPEAVAEQDRPVAVDDRSCPSPDAGLEGDHGPRSVEVGSHGQRPSSATASSMTWAPARCVGRPSHHRRGSLGPRRGLLIGVGEHTADACRCHARPRRSDRGRDWGASAARSPVVRTVTVVGHVRALHGLLEEVGELGARRATALAAVVVPPAPWARRRVPCDGGLRWSAASSLTEGAARAGTTCRRWRSTSLAPRTCHSYGCLHHSMCESNLTNISLERSNVMMRLLSAASGPDLKLPGQAGRRRPGPRPGPRSRRRFLAPLSSGLRTRWQGPWRSR